MKYFVLLLLFLTSQLSAQVFKVGYLFDSKNREWKKDQVFVVKDGIITEINPTTINSEMEVIDLSRKWILPALIDAHTHLFLNDSTYSNDFAEGLKKWVPQDKMRKIELATKRAKEMSRIGFTLARDLGNQGQVTQDDIESISELYIVSSGPGYTPELGQLPLHSPKELKIEYRKLIEDLSLHTYPVVKLYADEEPNHRYADLGDLTRMTRSAHQLNKIVAVHAILSKGIDLALASGADTLEHGSYASTEQLNILSSTSMIFVPTLSESLFLNPKRRQYFREEIAADFKRICTNIKRAHLMGIPVAFGTDHYFDFSGEDYGENLIEILQSYLKCGMNTNDVLKMATFTSAQTQNKFKLGQLSVGYLANFNVYSKSPALDLKNLNKVERVYRNGKLLSK